MPGFNSKALRSGFEAPRAGFEPPGLDLNPQGWIGAPRALERERGGPQANHGAVNFGLEKGYL